MSVAKPEPDAARKQKERAANADAGGTVLHTNLSPAATAALERLTRSLSSSKRAAVEYALQLAARNDRSPTTRRPAALFRSKGTR